MTVYIQNIPVGKEHPLVFFAGPCQLESLEHSRMMAEKIAEAAQKGQSPLCFQRFL